MKSGAVRLKPLLILRNLTARLKPRPFKTKGEFPHCYNAVFRIVRRMELRTSGSTSAYCFVGASRVQRIAGLSTALPFLAEEKLRSR